VVSPSLPRAPESIFNRSARARPKPAAATSATKLPRRGQPRADVASIPGEKQGQKDDPPGVPIQGGHLMIIWSGPDGHGGQFGGPDGEARVLRLPVAGFSR
jgi:hypothetical protein